MNSTEYVMAMINELRNNSGTNAKQDIIAKYCKAGKEEQVAKLKNDQTYSSEIVNRDMVCVNCSAT